MRVSTKTLQRLRLVALNLATGFLILMVTMAIEPFVPQSTFKDPYWLYLLGQIVGAVFALCVMILTFWSANILTDEIISLVTAPDDPR